ncbi:MAG: VCBS repeat domain-containing M23 family metallopeptidase [Candidatus Saccharimonadales bacterium]|nr:VCBS repeat domain-containing M23 family metallopeptidase [Candidatus Saccharimonadales bacterium]
MRLKSVIQVVIFVLTLGLVAPVTSLAPTTKASAQSSLCQSDAVILGLRGSGQTTADDISGYPLFGAQAGSVASVAEILLEQEGWSVESVSLNYTAVNGYSSHIPFVDPSYQESVQTGVVLLKDYLGQLDECSSQPLLVSLIGYSQGADAVKTALWELEDAGIHYEHLIGSIVLIADPHFDPNEPITMLGSSDGDDGLLDAWPLPSRYQSKSLALCVENDWICSANIFENDSTETHKTAYLGQLADDAGVISKSLLSTVLSTRNQYANSIVKWIDDSVTSWYVDGLGHRHWIADINTWDCLIEKGIGVHSLSSINLNRLPDRIGDHASCSSSGGGSDPPPPAVSGYRLPYPEGVSHVVTQAPDGQYSHPCPGNSCQAIDFAMNLNDPVSASTTGTVRSYSENESWNGGLGNYVMLEHADGWCSLYSHLHSVSSSISIGATAVQGQVIGGAGETGLATGTHLHFALVDCISWQSVDVDFIEVDDPIVGNWYISQNAYGTASVLPGPSNEQWLRRNHRGEGRLDFNGDGDGDIFNANGSKWKVKYNGTGTWVNLNDSSIRLEKLAFGDFNCDGITDVFNATGQFWQVSYGGTSQWTKINTSSIPTSNLAMVDANGDGCTDVFRTNGSKWFVSYGGTGSWQQVNTSTITLDQLILADLNRDGRTDAFRTTGSRWKVSYGLDTSWKTINDSTVPFGYLAIGNFGWGNKLDVFRANGSSWRVSPSGTGSWTTLAASTIMLHQMIFCDIDGNGKTDIVRVIGGKWKAAYNGTGPWVTIGTSSAKFSELAG